jgi:probable rRNA maturation factor
MKPVLLNNATEKKCPSIEQFNTWVNTVIDHRGSFFQVSIEIVDKATSQQLNKDYRHKDKPTNVLSFPLDLPEYVEEDLIGDLAICRDVLIEEAEQQNKNVDDHWAHLVMHGTLHLLGYDHIEDKEAEKMESLEIILLKKLEINNPYN